MALEHNFGKYARIEKERRFELSRVPVEVDPVFRRLHDRYLVGTELELDSDEALAAVEPLAETIRELTSAPGMGGGDLAG